MNNLERIQVGGMIWAPFVMLIERSIGLTEELGGIVRMEVRLDFRKNSE